MKYAILKCVNGNFTTDSEWDDINGAIVHFHGTCGSLWNDAGTETATVELVDEGYNVQPGYKEFIRPIRNEA